MVGVIRPSRFEYRNLKPSKFFLIGLALFFVFSFGVFAQEEYECEVMGVEGTAYLSNEQITHQQIKEGDILKTNDTIETDADSVVDVSFDKDWNNVMRIEENSKVRIQTIYPTSLAEERGALYAKLKALPKNSTFEVQTPTALASVRGTEYRTTFEDDQTNVFNLSDSEVYVYGLDSSGNIQDTPMILGLSEKTWVPQKGMAPRPVEKITQADMDKCQRSRDRIEKIIDRCRQTGRQGKIQDINRVKDEFRQARNRADKKPLSKNFKRGALDKMNQTRNAMGPKEVDSRQEARIDRQKDRPSRPIWDRQENHSRANGSSAKNKNRPRPTQRPGRSQQK